MTSWNVDFNVDKIALKYEQDAERGLNAMTMQGAERIQNAMNESPRTGRIYKKGKTVTHQASAPGEAPAPDTGNLINSVFSGIIDRVRGAITGRIVVNKEYAAHLEIGTAKMRPRPYIASTIKANWDYLMQVFSKVMTNG